MISLGLLVLLGNEKSPEMLVEIAAAINKRDKKQTVNISEVPHQTFLDALVEENPRIASLERRIARLSQSKNISIYFEAVVTHEISDTIHELSDQTNCDWLVMAWNGGAHSRIPVSNTIGWLLTHINSDFALFNDDGIRYIGKVLLVIRPVRKDKNFIAVADRICEFYKASLTSLHVAPEKTSIRNNRPVRFLRLTMKDHLFSFSLSVTSSS